MSKQRICPFCEKEVILNENNNSFYKHGTWDHEGLSLGCISAFYDKFLITRLTSVIKKCLFGKELNQYNRRHIYKCKMRDMNLTKEQIKLKYLQFNFGDNILDDVCNDYEHLYSLPMLREKYDNIDSKAVFFLLKLRNIKPRTISESAKKISQEKYKQTCREKYGVDNVS